jgi:hypothetical protein
MNTFSLIAGALTLRTDTFKALNERSDVFLRGFLVVFMVGLVAGAFAAGAELTTSVLRPPNEQVVTQEALRGFENSYAGPPELRSTIEPYITEFVGMVFDLSRLPPQAGPAFRPFVRLLRWVGESIATPFGQGFLGYLLIGTLFVHLASRWLGGRAGIAQMLGLGALGFAPQVLGPVSSLLRLAGNLSGSNAFSPVENLIGLVAFVWGALILVKGTAVAQQFSYGRAIGAILIAVLVVIVVGVLLAAGLAVLVGAGVATLIAAIR